MPYTSGFKSDHICNKGHALYIVSGSIKIYVDGNTTAWNEGDALIIPNDIPHEVYNDRDKEAKVFVVDNN